MPPIESLDAESDFTPFMQPSVDPGLKRAALKKLFGDPRFNVMDGLDVYIDDYTKSDPIPEGLLEKMEQMRHLGVFRKEGEGAEPQPAPESGETAAGDVSVTASKLPAEQSVAPPASVTSSAETPAPPVGKSGNAEG